MPERLTLRARAQPQNIPKLRRQVVSYANRLGAPESVLEAVQLAVSEALTNVVVHAYADSEAGDMTLEAWHDDGRHLVVVVTDEGRGFLPNSVSPGLGFGLGLMAQMAGAGFLVSSRDGGSGTLVSLRFALPGHPATLSERFDVLQAGGPRPDDRGTDSLGGERKLRTDRTPAAD